MTTYRISIPPEPRIVGRAARRPPYNPRLGDFIEEQLGKAEALAHETGHFWPAMVETQQTRAMYPSLYSGEMPLWGALLDRGSDPGYTAMVRWKGHFPGLLLATVMLWLEARVDASRAGGYAYVKQDLVLVERMREGDLMRFTQVTGQWIWTARP